MFKFFRFLLILLSAAACVLSVFALTGSYKNAGYLTDTYLLNIHLNKMNLTSLINVDELKKQASTEDIASATTSSLAGTASADDFDYAMLDDVTMEQLGLADTYSISYWGYCRGIDEGSDNTYAQQLGNFGQDFDNSKINYTWCSQPKAGFRFNPTEVLKSELKNTLDSGLSDEDAVDSTVKTVIDFLIDNVDDDAINWPPRLKSLLTLFSNLLVASFALILAAAVLSFIAVVIEVFGCFVDPSSGCLSCLHFLYYLVVCILMVVGSILITFTMAFSKTQVNKATQALGIKSYLSINFYAFAWSAAAATILAVLVNLLGHCCGLFGTKKRNFTQVSAQPPMAYEHFDTESSVYEKPSYSVRSGMPNNHHTSHH